MKYHATFMLYNNEMEQIGRITAFFDSGETVEISQERLTMNLLGSMYAQVRHERDLMVRFSAEGSPELPDMVIESTMVTAIRLIGYTETDEDS